MSEKTGIRERILAATSETEVSALLKELGSYDFVSAKTFQACHNAARRRRKALALQKEGK